MATAKEHLKEKTHTKTAKSVTPVIEISLDKVVTVAKAESKSHFENPSAVYRVVGASSEDNVSLPAHMFSTTDQE